MQNMGILGAATKGRYVKYEDDYLLEPIMLKVHLEQNEPSQVLQKLKS